MRAAAAMLRKLVALTGFAFLVATITATFLTPQPASARCGPPMLVPLPVVDEPAPPPGADIEAPEPGGEPAGKDAGRPRRLVGTVNLNTAGTDALELLPGVGPTKAARVVAYRERRGEFERVVDLRRVRGFGRKTVRRLLPYLTLDGETTLRRE